MEYLTTIVNMVKGVLAGITAIVTIIEFLSSEIVDDVPNRLLFSLSYGEQTRLRKHRNRKVVCSMLVLAASICILASLIIQSLISIFFCGRLDDDFVPSCLLCVLLTLLFICILGFIIIYFRLENKKSFERHIKRRRQEMDYTIVCISLISLVLVFSSLIVYYINNEDMTFDLFIIIAIGFIFVAAYTVYLSYSHMNEHRIKEYSENKAYACFVDKSGSIIYIFHCMESGDYLCSKKDNLIDADEVFIVKCKHIMNVQIKPHENPINEYYQIEQPDNEK